MRQGETEKDTIIVQTLSNLSTADDIARILSGGTPHSSKIPSNNFLWLICGRTLRPVLHDQVDQVNACLYSEIANI